MNVGHVTSEIAGGSGFLQVQKCDHCLISKKVLKGEQNDKCCGMLSAYSSIAQVRLSTSRFPSCVDCGTIFLALINKIVSGFGWNHVTHMPNLGKENALVLSIIRDVAGNELFMFSYITLSHYPDFNDCSRFLYRIKHWWKCFKARRTQHHMRC